jgi:hypothetical protein
MNPKRRWPTPRRWSRVPRLPREDRHVCVQQTALDLRGAGKQVFIVAEASGSRAPANRDLAFERMRGHGIEIVSREMVAFEWLQRGGTELFREVNRDFIR